MSFKPAQLALFGESARKAIEAACAELPPLAGKRRKGKAKSDLEERFAQDLHFHGIAGWVPQGLWCPNRKFAGDFVFGRAMLVVELEGGIYGRPCPTCKRMGSPSHSSAGGIERDIEKSQLAAVHGWTLLRLGPKDVRSGKGIEVLKQILARNS